MGRVPSGRATSTLGRPARPPWLREAWQLALESGDLGLVPRRLPCDGLLLAEGGPLDLLGPTTLGRRRLSSARCLVDRVRARRRRPPRWRPPSAACPAPTRPARSSPDSRACSARRSRTGSAAPSASPVSSTTAEPSAGHRQPASWHRRLEGEARNRGRAARQHARAAADPARGVAPHRVDQATAAGSGDGVEPATGGRIRGDRAWRQPLLDQQAAALAGQCRDTLPIRRDRRAHDRRGPPRPPRAARDRPSGPRRGGDRRACARHGRSVAAPPHRDARVSASTRPRSEATRRGRRGEPLRRPLPDPARPSPGPAGPPRARPGPCRSAPLANSSARLADSRFEPRPRPVGRSRSSAAARSSAARRSASASRRRAVSASAVRAASARRSAAVSSSCASAAERRVATSASASASSRSASVTAASRSTSRAGTGTAIARRWIAASASAVPRSSVEPPRITPDRLEVRRQAAVAQLESGQCRLARSS